MLCNLHFFFFFFFFFLQAQYFVVEMMKQHMEKSTAVSGVCDIEEGVEIDTKQPLSPSKIEICGCVCRKLVCLSIDNNVIIDKKKMLPRKVTKCLVI